MKLAMFCPKGMELERGWPGRIDGGRIVQLAAQTLQVFFTAGGALREHADYALADVELRAPVLHPPGIRFFREGTDFVFGNTAAVFGPEEEVPYPQGSSDLRSVPAVAAVVGAGGAIGGFTGANAWTAADLAGAKSYDFALSLGPILVTADAYEAAPEWEARLAAAALNTNLRPGDLLVSPLDGDSPAQRGDLIEVAAAGIGVLRNRVGV